jgi:hypothetical protein
MHFRVLTVTLTEQAVTTKHCYDIPCITRSSHKGSGLPSWLEFVAFDTTCSAALAAVFRLGVAAADDWVYDHHILVLQFQAISASNTMDEGADFKRVPLKDQFKSH